MFFFPVPNESIILAFENREKYVEYAINFTESYILGSRNSIDLADSPLVAYVINIGATYMPTSGEFLGYIGEIRQDGELIYKAGILFKTFNDASEFMQHLVIETNTEQRVKQDQVRQLDYIKKHKATLIAPYTREETIRTLDMAIRLIETLMKGPND